MNHSSVSGLRSKLLCCELFPHLLASGVVYRQLRLLPGREDPIPNGDTLSNAVVGKDGLADDGRRSRRLDSTGPGNGQFFHELCAVFCVNQSQTMEKNC